MTSIILNNGIIYIARLDNKFFIGTIFKKKNILRFFGHVDGEFASDRLMDAHLKKFFESGVEESLLDLRLRQNRKDDDFIATVTFDANPNIWSDAKRQNIEGLGDEIVGDIVKMMKISGKYILSFIQESSNFNLF